MYKILCNFIIFLHYTAHVFGQGYYNVIGPRIIRPNSEYHCAISVEGDIAVPIGITATLQGQSHKGIPFFAQYKDVIAPYSSTTCKFEVGDIDDGVYKLYVIGSGGLDFNSNIPLNYIPKSYSVFVQTDKPIYKPGSTILFRAIVLNSALKPAAELRSETLHIQISDGKSNTVKEWHGVEAPRGVFTGEFKIADAPVLGTWNISITIHGQTYSKSIEVAEYILPKFIVDVTAPKHVTFKENVIRINVNTRYNYGKRVKGEVTVAVYPTIYSGVIQPIFQNPVRKVLQIHGQATVEFDIGKDIGLNDEYERLVMVDVTVEEQPSGRRQNNSAQVHIHKYDYKMDLIKSADYFKPGLKYEAYIQISNYDGTPIKSSDNEITVRHGYSRRDEVYETTTHKVDNNGFVKLEYFTPSQITNTTALRIEAEYKDLKERISPIPAAVSFSDVFLDANIETKQLLVNKDVDILINCTEPMNYINYVLIARGDVLLTNTFQIDNKKMFRFRFTAVHAMVPRAHLIVYYVRKDGELIADAVDVEVDGLFENFIDIDVNTDESEPNLDVELTVQARQNSYIGLMAVDEHVNLLKQNYDISSNDVSDELMKYDIAEEYPFDPIARQSKNMFTWRPGSSNPHSAIYESGADIITNSHVNRQKPTLEDIYLRPIFYGSSTVKPDRGFGIQFHSVTRPPLAGPYAFSRIPRPVWNKPKVFLTKEISDTWLFTNFSSGYDGKSSIRRKVPESLTNWLITGFSLDPIRGLALISEPKKLKVTKSFIVSLDLPYSVQRGEIVAIPVVLYNPTNQDISAEVTVHNTQQKFEFAEVSNEVTASKRIELYRRKKLTVGKNNGASVSFMITPLEVGHIEIKVTANSPRNQDVVIKHLNVELEGETEFYTKAVFLNLRQTSTIQKSINFTIPKNAVENSEKIEVSAIGNLLGAYVVNLDHIIRLPTGCGEQNLIKFMPSLIILQYLRNTRQMTPTIEHEAVHFLENSYQQQLTYQRDDGSFSPFGHRDNAGSIWLTAYVSWALQQARSFISVDTNIIVKAHEWLSNMQGLNGSFVETGNIIYEDVQNRDGNSLALTAYTLLSFMENQKYGNYTNTIYKGLDYITRNLNEQESTYTIALCSYVLHKAKHTSRQTALNLLESRSTSNENMKWWAKDTSQNETNNPWTRLARSIDVEMTSYALLSYLEANLLDEAVSVLNWLVNQENSLGGFSSSQDTVVGLQAFYKLVTRLALQTNIQIEYNFKPRGINRFTINKDSAMILQTYEIDKSARELNLTAKGTGIGLFRVSYKYNMNVTGPWPLFTLDPQVDKNSNMHHLQLSVCTAYVSRNLTESHLSNMAIMEVNLPSGFTADRDSLPSLEVSQNVQKVETSRGDTRVILYFNNLTIAEYCPTISAFRTHKVAKQKPVSVVIYDYYDTSRRARIFYTGPKSTLCDICDEDDCGDICENQPKPPQRTLSDDGGGSTTMFASIWILLISLTINIFK